MGERRGAPEERWTSSARIAIDGAEGKRNARARLESARRTEESREARERANRVPRKEPATGGGAVSAVGSSSLSASESDGGRNTTSWYSITDDDGASSAAPGGDPGGARLDIPRADGTRARRGEVNARGAPRSVPLSGGGGRWRTRPVANASSHCPYFAEVRQSAQRFLTGAWAPASHVA